MTDLNESGFDFIGDVHGSQEKLIGLLRCLGYEEVGGVFSHPNRQAIFVGDLIDRGPNQLEVLRTVEAMVRSGTAQIVMGNHEFNALAYSAADPDKLGEFCRSHSKKNRHQHEAFLDQLTEAERTHYLAWFMTFPLWLDLGDVRVVHACWHEQSLALIEKQFNGSKLTTEDDVVKASRKEPEKKLYDAMETLLKGPETDLRKYGLPSFHDKDGEERHEARIKWWIEDSLLVRDLVEIPSDTKTAEGKPYPEIKARLEINGDDIVKVTGSKPVIYGHYWRRWDPEDDGFRTWLPTPGLDWTRDTACVDFSAVRGGPLVAYRWNEGDDHIIPTRYAAYR